MNVTFHVQKNYGMDTVVGPLVINGNLSWMRLIYHLHQVFQIFIYLFLLYTALVVRHNVARTYPLLFQKGGECLKGEKTWTTSEST